MRDYTQEELLIIAAPYFEQGNSKMYGTSDGNLFHEVSRIDALNHSKGSKTELYELIDSKLDEPVQNTETNNEVIEQIRRGRKPSKSIENVE